MYFRQSSTCIKALVTRSFKHCTAFSEFSSYFKSWIAKIENSLMKKWQTQHNDSKVQNLAVFQRPRPQLKVSHKIHSHHEKTKITEKKP